MSMRSVMPRACGSGHDERPTREGLGVSYRQDGVADHHRDVLLEEVQHHLRVEQLQLVQHRQRIERVGDDARLVVGQRLVDAGQDPLRHRRLPDADRDVGNVLEERGAQLPVALVQRRDDVRQQLLA